MRYTAALLALCLPTAAFAVPGSLSHQGRITDPLGAPIDGTHTLTFALWDAADNGTQLYTTTLTTELEQGFYSVTLEPLTASTFGSDAVWLELSVDGGPSFGGRVPLHTVPWAFRADTTRNLSGGVVDASEIRVNGTPVITSSGGTLSSLSCSSGQVASWDGASWGCASLDHTHDVSDVNSGVFEVARIPVGTDSSTVAAGDHAHAAADWSSVTNRPPGLDDGDDNTTYTAGSGLNLAGTEFSVVDAYVNTSGDAMNAEYPTLTLDHPVAGGQSGIRLNSRHNNGSDFGYIVFQDDSGEGPGTSTENLRMSIGVTNDFRQSASHSDELWLQGGGRLVSNVGTYDAELQAIVGTPAGSSADVGHEWRANNVVVMTVDSSGVLNPVGGLACPSGMTAVAGGRLCVDNAHSGPSDINPAIVDCRTRQARVCTHSDMQQACGVSGFNPYAGSITGWYGDHARDEVTGGNTDDEYLTWNRDICTTNGNNDGPGLSAGTTSLNYRCCL